MNQFILRQPGDDDRSKEALQLGNGGHLVDNKF
jgi:hypothetical protein